MLSTRDAVHHYFFVVCGRVHSGPHCKGFRTSDAQRNVMGQSTEMPSLVSMLFGLS